MDVYDLATKKLTAAANGRLKPRNGVNRYNGDYYTTASRIIDVSRLQAYTMSAFPVQTIIIEENREI